MLQNKDMKTKQNWSIQNKSNWIEYSHLADTSCKDKLYKFVCGVSSHGGDHEVDQRKIEEQERKQILSSLQQNTCARYDGGEDWYAGLGM